MEILWTCPICGNECVDDAASRCTDCHRSMHSSHITEHRCTDCRKKLGIDAPKQPSIYVDDRRLGLRLASYEL